MIIETNSMEGEIGNFLPIEPTRIATRKKNWNVPPGNRKGATNRGRLYTSGQSKRPIEITMMARREMLSPYSILYIPTDITKECKYFSH